MIDAENNTQLSKNAAVWTKGRISWLWQTLPIVAFLVGGIVWMSYTGFQQKLHVHQYREAPNCTPTSSSTSSLPPCIRAPMQITHKEYSHNTKSRDDYYLTLRTANGAVKQVSLLGHLLWDRAKIGDTVIAKSWKGKIVLVSAYGYFPMTDDHPEANSFSNSYGLTMCIIALLLMPFVIAKGWREQGVISDTKDNQSKLE